MTIGMMMVVAASKKFSLRQLENWAELMLLAGNASLAGIKLAASARYHKFEIKLPGSLVFSTLSHEPDDDSGIAVSASLTQ